MPCTSVTEDRQHSELRAKSEARKNVSLMGRNTTVAEKSACAEAWDNAEHHGIGQRVGGAGQCHYLCIMELYSKDLIR